MSDTPVPELEAEPAVVAERFGAVRPGLVQYASDLAQHGERLGLLGPREYGRLWTRHLLNCAALADVIDSGSRVADVGSGAGLPGIVLAIVRPDTILHLIEPMERRAAWLAEEVDRLGLANVVVHRARSEDLAGSLQVDVVTARAVSALKNLLGWTVPLLVPDGELLLMKGRSAEQEIQKARGRIARLHIADVRIEQLGAGYLTEPTTVVRGRRVE